MSNLHVPGPYDRELELALRLARSAGEILRTFYEVPPVVQWKGGREPVTEADRAANAYLVAQIAQAFPGDAILAEESSIDAARFSRPRCWMIDPLDGTSEFIAHNDEFCVMLGLVEAGRPVVGVMHMPIMGGTYAAATGSGAFIDDFGERYPLHVSNIADLGSLRPLVSRSHRSPLLDPISKALGTQRERIAGSLGYKSGLLAKGEADCYVHPSAGPKEWDTCAPEIILREAGGVMTDCWGRALCYNQPDIRRRYGVMAGNSVCYARLTHVVTRVLDEIGIDPDFGFPDTPAASFLSANAA